MKVTDNIEEVEQRIRGYLADIRIVLSRDFESANLRAAIEEGLKAIVESPEVAKVLKSN